MPQSTMLGLHPLIHVPNYMDHYSFTDPWGRDGWVGHVGWPIVDGLTTKWSPIQLAVWCRMWKVRQPRLCYTANRSNFLKHCRILFLWPKYSWSMCWRKMFVTDCNFLLNVADTLESRIVGYAKNSDGMLYVLHLIFFAAFFVRIWFVIVGLLDKLQIIWNWCRICGKAWMARVTSSTFWVTTTVPLAGSGVELTHCVSWPDVVKGD